MGFWSNAVANRIHLGVKIGHHDEMKPIFCLWRSVELLLFVVQETAFT